MTAGKCRWVLADGFPCNARTSYRIVVEDGGGKGRKYAPFCTEHQERADAQDRLDADIDNDHDSEDP